MQRSDQVEANPVIVADGARNQIAGRPISTVVRTFSWVVRLRAGERFWPNEGGATESETSVLARIERKPFLYDRTTCRVLAITVPDRIVVTLAAVLFPIERVTANRRNPFDLYRSNAPGEEEDAEVEKFLEREEREGIGSRVLAGASERKVII